MVRPSAQPYFTIHVRRGDKIKEAEYVPLAKYLGCATSASSPVNNCHVMTDDYNIVLQLRQDFLAWTFCCASPHLADTTRGASTRTLQNSGRTARPACWQS